MILDRLDTAKRWTSVHPGFASAFAFLRRKDLAELANGRHEIDGQRLYAIVIRDKGRGRSQAKLEMHRKYIDIQFLVEGTDVMGWKSTSTCTKPAQPFNEEQDVQLFLDPPDSWVTTPPGSFAIFFPEDAHAPMGAEESLHKVVVKVAVNWT